MFTIQQIKDAHSKVKSGTDFPAYIRAIKTLGVRTYAHFLTDGHVDYTGADGFSTSSEAKWLSRDIAEPASIEKLKQYLAVHQGGETDYPTFCFQAAEAGVEKWVVDTIHMTCNYYDKNGKELLSEHIPG